MFRDSVRILIGVALLASAGGALAQPRSRPIQHDAEHYMLLAQHGDRWAREDRANAARLAQVREANGGRRPQYPFRAHR